MSLFQKLHHSLSFQLPDPLGDGLGDAIAAERAEPEAITLDEVDTRSLIAQWDKVVDDIEHDPEWFKFANDED